MYNLKWSKGNAKLNKDTGGKYKIVGYGIPANLQFVDSNGCSKNTCPGACACAAVCYAKQGAYLWKSVMNARQHNLKLSQEATFAQMAIDDLKKMKSINAVRIHDSGDFYDYEYYQKWCQIAKALPEKTFYAYTKTVDIDLYTDKPDNLKIVQSLGGKFDNLVQLNMPHSRIFATHQDMDNAGYVDGNINELPAIEGATRIGLVYHGTRNLTDAQKSYFS